MNSELLLKLSGKELSKALGEVLQPEHESIGTHKNCIHCNCNLSTFEGIGVCTRPIPLDDWNVAMKWRDWGVEEVGFKAFHETLYEMYKTTWQNKADICYETWLECKAQPKHYLKAAALYKLRSDR